MLDELRNTGDDFEDFGEEDATAYRETDADSGSGTFLGMTAAERMILSILLFILVTVGGVLLLLATGRIAF